MIKSIFVSQRCFCFSSMTEACFLRFFLFLVVQNCVNPARCCCVLEASTNVKNAPMDWRKPPAILPLCSHQILAASYCWELIGPSQVGACLCIDVPAHYLCNISLCAISASRQSGTSQQARVTGERDMWHGRSSHLGGSTSPSLLKKITNWTLSEQYE